MNNMNENNEIKELDDCTNTFKDAVNESEKKEKKNIFSRAMNKDSYNDKGVYFFNQSVFIGTIILVCFCMVLFFK